MAKRTPKRLPVVRPWEEVAQLLKAATRQRDRLLLMMAAFMGLRAFETCKLNVEDVNWKEGLLFLHLAKNSRDAVLPIPKFLISALRGWIGSRTSGPLFQSRKGGGHLTTRAIRQLVKRVAIAAGLPEPTKPRKYHYHGLRAAFCTEKIRRGVPLPYVQRLMRHAHIETLLRYTGIVPEDLRAGMDT